MNGRKVLKKLDMLNEAAIAERTDFQWRSCEKSQVRRAASAIQKALVNIFSERRYPITPLMALAKGLLQLAQFL